MKVNECMSSLPEFLPSNCSISDAARHMTDMNCGYFPIAENDRLIGIVTDRDIVVRALANGVSLDDKVSNIQSPTVLYCWEDDDVTVVLNNMSKQHVQRLIVLNNEKSMDMIGVITLADIADRVENDPVLAEKIVDCCRHYQRPNRIEKEIG